MYAGTEAMTDDIERRVVHVLGALGVPYELISIDPAFADTAAFCERYGVPPEHAANTIIVASKKEPKQFCACVVTATTRLDVNHAVKRLMGVSKLSFASAEETTALTGMLIGGVTVFALPDGLPIYVDDRLMALPWIILGSGSRSSKVKASPEVLRRLPGTAIVSGLGVDAPPSSAP
jgi:prolyl-tRNA editing enzyme YbaK/EbsC (Cys-tRNA(Pro) deacylase)